MSPILVALGNPLLDMQVTQGESLLAKYNLKPNDAVLAEGNQAEMSVPSLSNAVSLRAKQQSRRGRNDRD